MTSLSDDTAVALAEAFGADPAFRWILPNAHTRAARLLRYFRAELRWTKRCGRIIATPQGNAALLWRLPGRTCPSLVEQAGTAGPFLRAFGTALPRALRVSGQIDAHRDTPDDYWYLKYAGVAPQAQGRGLGGRLLRAGLALADEARKAVLLETANPDNLALYGRFGFRVVSRWRVGVDGPEFWTMRRDQSAVGESSSAPASS